MKRVKIWRKKFKCSCILDAEQSMKNMGIAPIIRKFLSEAMDFAFCKLEALLEAKH